LEAGDVACPVCFGGDDVVVRESLNAGIGVLLGVTAVVLGAFLRFFLRLARRSREHAHLVDPDRGVGLPAFAKGYGEARRSALGAHRRPDQGGL
jgi:hypothetical protein